MTDSTSHPVTQLMADTQPYDIDPPAGAGRANRADASDLFWYHPADLNPDDNNNNNNNNDNNPRRVRRNMMGVQIGQLDMAATGPGPFDIGSLHLVLFPPAEGHEMELKIAYNGSVGRRNRHWGYDRQGFSVFPPDDPDVGEEKRLVAGDVIDTTQLRAREHVGGVPGDSGVAYLHGHWWQLYERGGWQAVCAGARRVCMARDVNGDWVLQDRDSMVSQAAYHFAGPMSGWEEV